MDTGSKFLGASAQSGACRVSYRKRSRRGNVTHDTPTAFYTGRVLVSDFDYHLPEELIAQEPLADRSASRMLHIQRESGEVHGALS